MLDAAAINPYRLLDGSPCINAGADQDWMAAASDLDGSRRIVGTVVDIGACEVQPRVGLTLQTRWNIVGKVEA